MSEQSFGQARVRTSHNPSTNPVVDAIKDQTAALIDLCEQWKRSAANGDALANGERARCAALAQTAFEEAAMWAVKAATTPGV